MHVGLTCKCVPSVCSDADFNIHKYTKFLTWLTDSDDFLFGNMPDDNPVAVG